MNRPALSASGRRRAVAMLVLAFALAPLPGGPLRPLAQAAGADGPVLVADLDTEILTFLGRELDAHLSGIRSLSPPPDRVRGALTTGEFSWGTFMRALAAYGELSGATTVDGRDLVRTVADIGLLEVRLGGTRFSQLYAALSLRHFGPDLTKNTLWLALGPDDRRAWRTLVDATRFYDPQKQELINLPENYLGVASRIAAIAWETGLLADRALLDGLLDRAARQFTSGALYADDAPPAGRFDRYSNEYARYVWEAAKIAGRRDLLDRLRPSLRVQMRLWWDLVSADGYGYPWGRSLGVVSYLDTLEIPGFLAVEPEFRPAPLADLAAVYHQSWRWLRRDFKDERHLLSIFDFGRGHFAYISRDREWQQTVGFFGKLAHAHRQLMEGLRRDQIARVPSTPSLGPVARFERFRTTGRQAGVWVVRQGPMRFALPITTGTQPGVADYLPAPHGLPGFAAPVERIVPALVPFLELEDGTTIVATDGADAIDAAPDGRTLRATWTRWARLGGKPAETTDPGLESAIDWKLDGETLVRTETLTARRRITIRRWWVIVPVTGSRWRTSINRAARSDTFESPEGTLTITVPQAGWPYTIAGRATGDAPDGRGARAPIPVHLVLEAKDIRLSPGQPRGWTLRLSVEAP